MRISNNMYLVSAASLYRTFLCMYDLNSCVLSYAFWRIKNLWYFCAWQDVLWLQVYLYAVAKYAKREKSLRQPTPQMEIGWERFQYLKASTCDLVPKLKVSEWRTAPWQFTTFICPAFLLTKSSLHPAKVSYPKLCNASSMIFTVHSWWPYFGIGLQLGLLSNMCFILF